MYYYFREYCKPYYQLMPVQYEKQSDGQYHKVGMACTNASICGVSLEECRHFKSAPDIMDKKDLYKKKIGE